PKTNHRHFDRSCSRFCEQRSGEIRFSTTAAPALAYEKNAPEELALQPGPSLQTAPSQGQIYQAPSLGMKIPRKAGQYAYIKNNSSTAQTSPGPIPGGNSVR